MHFKIEPISQPFIKHLLGLTSGLLLTATYSQADIISTERVSVTNSGAETDGGSYMASISANGESIVFSSDANNLKSNGSDYFYHIYVRNRTDGSTEQVDVDNSGNSGIGYADSGNISANGRYVVYSSSADNLVNNDTNSTNDIFIRDLQEGITERVSLSYTGDPIVSPSYEPDVSNDGRYVVFSSLSDQIVENDFNGTADIFLRDRQTGSTQRINVSNSGAEANFSSYAPRISDNGTHVVYSSSADNLTPNDMNGVQDIFVYSIANGTTTRVSVSSSGIEANQSSNEPYVSADGRYIVFSSMADNLVANTDYGYENIFIHDLETSTTELITRGFDDTPSNGYSFRPSVSDGGRYVSFMSSANNLVDNDTNSYDDVFVVDRVSDTTERISLDMYGNDTFSWSFMPIISSNALFIAYESDASNIVSGDTNNYTDIFVAQMDHEQAGGSRITITPSATTVDPFVDPFFSVDVNVSATDLYGLEVRCFADSNLAYLEGGTYGSLFDESARLEIPMLLNSPAMGDWQGSLSLMNPASPISGSGTFATLDFSALEEQTSTLDISCTSSASDQNGQPIILEMENASITIDDGIHESDGATISGNVSLPNGADPTGVEITLQIDDRSISTFADSDGDFSFSPVKQGLWVVSYQHPQYVNSCSVTSTLGGDITIDSTTMIAGDINGDDLIDIADFTVISSGYGTTSADPNYNPAADLNGDGEINIFDLSILGSHFGINGCDPSTIDPSIEPSVTYSTSFGPSVGTTMINEQEAEFTWDRTTAYGGAMAHALAYAKPTDINEFALGIQLEGLQSSYSLRISNYEYGNYIYVFYDADTPSPILNIETYTDGYHDFYNHSVPLLMDQLEIGFKADTLTVNLGALSFAHPLMNSLGNSTTDWEIEVELIHSGLTSDSGVTTAKLVSDSLLGLNLPSSQWQTTTPLP